jgi:molecular chaperone GrpE (heat shock protein)
MEKHNTEADDLEIDESEPQPPAIDPEELEALRVRAEGAERKLREIQTTFMNAKAELDATRARLERDLARKVELKFSDLVAGLLECADDLDRAIEHGATIRQAGPVVQGVALARERFLGALLKAGLRRIEPLGEPYDPNVAEAVGVTPVSKPEQHDTVIAVESAGYALGERVVRPARVLVGRLVS